jgi:uncharacterized integral membrane protein
MRLIQAVVFLAFLAVVGVFAIQNTDAVTVNFWNWRQSSSVAAFTIVVYLLGMLSGWAVVGFVRRSLRQVADYPRHRTT